MEVINNIESQFQILPVTEDMMIAGHTFSSAQRAVIQNLIASYAHEHLNLKFDCDKPHLAAIEQARVKGMIDALQYLLDAHNELQLAKDDSDNQE